MKNKFNILVLALLFSLTGCIREEMPTSVVSDEQVKALNNTQLSMLYGISSYMVSYNAWGSSSYYMNDWGYPCQMYFREVCTEDFPVYRSTYDYWTYHENASYTSYYTGYTWTFYYHLIRNCNNLIGAIDTTSASVDSRRYLGSALAFRAMAYMDLSRLYEYRPTGFDVDAQAANVMGLTVPIVTEKTTEDQQVKNPRATYDEMCAFILSDLSRAERLLDDYNFSDVSLPGIDAVRGLFARYWLERATRTGLSDDYSLAYDYAKLVLDKHSVTTRDQWHDSKTGFNTANQAWIWRCRIGGKEQQPAYYCTYGAQMASEPVASFARSYNAYRCIGSYLYGKINTLDWRRTTWVDPADAGQVSDSLCTVYQTLLDAEDFSQLPAYANLKFRPGEGNLTDAQTWINGDLPLMRVEEMYFIAAEAQAHIAGYSAGLAVLKQLMDTRYEDGNYAPATRINSLQSFMTELMVQKRIEFWGEGILFFDYKRLNIAMDRTLSDNYESSFQLRSLEGYAAPWLNFFIPREETQRNTACLANPDVSDLDGKYK